MRRNVKVKSSSSRVPLRKAALSASPASRRTFPAWIDAEDGAAFSVSAVTPRVRDALILRTVTKKKATKSRSEADDARAR